MLKAQDVQQKMHPEDTNVFVDGIIEKLANLPNDLENECYADFATGYVNVNTEGVLEDDDIEICTTPVSNPDEEELGEGKIIVLKNGLGKMKNLNSISCNEVSQG